MWLLDVPPGISCCGCSFLEFIDQLILWLRIGVKYVENGTARRDQYSSVFFYVRLWYNTFTNREPTKFTSLSKIQGVVFNSISCCVLNNTVTNHVRRTRISRAARGRFAPGVDARCVLIASFVYFIAFVYKFRGYRDDLAESPAK